MIASPITANTMVFFPFSIISLLPLDINIWNPPHINKARARTPVKPNAPRMILPITRLTSASFAVCPKGLNNVVASPVVLSSGAAASAAYAGTHVRKARKKRNKRG